MGPRPFSRGNSETEAPNVQAKLASMGPRPFSRGNSRGGHKGPAPHHGLQWGRGLSAAEIENTTLSWLQTGLLQWGRGLSAAEITNAFLRSVRKDQLQWGRGLSAAEIATHPIVADRKKLASMGPRPFSRGNPRPPAEQAPEGEHGFNGAAAFQPRKSQP